MGETLSKSKKSEKATLRARKEYEERFERRLDFVRQNFDREFELPHRREPPEYFKMDAKVAVGERGKIYRVRIRESDEILALKIIRKKYCRQERFDQARQIMFSAASVFVVKAFSWYEDPKKYYLAMEYAVYGDSGRYSAKRALPERIVKLTAAQIVLALEYLHTANVLHRDVVKENILIFDDGYIKLGGFKRSKRGPRARSLTGRPHVIAPEVFKSEEYGAGADWWALGIFIYEALFIDHPFSLREWEPVDQMSAAARLDLKFPVVTHANAPVRRFIRQLLEKNCKHRLGTLAGGAMDIMQQEWFSDISFVSLYNKTMPMIKYLEPVKGRALKSSS